GGEQAGAFERDIDAEVLPGKLCGIADRKRLDRSVAAIDGVTFDRHFARESAVDRIEAQQMRIGLRRGQVIDGDDSDILAITLENRAQHHATDAAKSIDGNPYCHYRLLLASNAVPRRPSPRQ